MSTLDDLRATLAAHTPAEDAGLSDRAASVRSRVKVVRRRRRIATVTASIAAVAVVAAGVALPRLVTEQGEADLAAVTSVTSGGFGYDLVDVYESKPGADELEVPIPRSDSAQVVALLAEDLDGGSLTLQPRVSDDTTSIVGFPVDRLVHDGAGVPVPLDDWDAGAADAMPYVLHLEGGGSHTRIGLALYRRNDTMPDGVVDPTGSTVFREQIGSRKLIDAAFAEPGQAEVTFTFTGPLDHVSLDGFCAVSSGSVRGSKQPWVNVALDGDGPLAWSGCGDPAEDAGSGGYSFDGHGDGRHTVRVWASEKADGEPKAYDGMVLGGAAYDTGDSVSVHGMEVDTVVEFAGRTWQLDRDDITESEPGEHSLSRPVSDGPVLVGYAAENVSRIDASADGDVSSLGGGGSFVSRSSEPGAASSLDTILLPPDGGTYTIEWPKDEAEAAAAILVYRPLD